MDAVSWAAITTAVCLPGGSVVGWVWTIARSNAATHRLIRQDLDVAIKGVRDQHAGDIAAVEAEQSRMRNDIQEFKDRASDRYVAKDGLQEFRDSIERVDAAIKLLDTKFDAKFDRLMMQNSSGNHDPHR